MTQDHLPPEFHPIDATERLICWYGTDGSIELTRDLTRAEQTVLQNRFEDLSRALEPFDRQCPNDLDRAAVAITDMYGSFSSMRYSESEGLAKIDSLIGALQRNALPTWAIEQACRNVQDGGFERTDGKRNWVERSWPPTDSELVAVAKALVRRRAWAAANAGRLLGASKPSTP